MNRFDSRYFLDEVQRFRSIMGSKSKSIETIDKAFEGLTFVYLNAPKEDRNDIIFECTADEWTRRRAFALTRIIV